MPDASHRHPNSTDEPEHILARASQDADDTAGHRAAFVPDDGSTDGPDTVRVRATDEGDDTEGHFLASV